MKNIITIIFILIISLGFPLLVILKARKKNHNVNKCPNCGHSLIIRQGGLKGISSTICPSCGYKK